MKWNNYVMIQVFVSYENMLATCGKWKTGKINEKIENATSKWFFLRWFQHDISIVSRNKQIGCFTHKPIRFYFSLDRSTILSGCFYQNLNKNVWTFIHLTGKCRLPAVTSNTAFPQTRRRFYCCCMGCRLKQAYAQ